MFFRPFKKISTSLSVAAVLALLLVTFALADNVQNDVVVGGNDTFTLGGSTTVSYRIRDTNGDGQNGCNASDGTPAVVTINTPAGVSASPNPLSFTACGTFLPTTFSASAAGNYPITVSVSDPGAGTYNTTPATFTLKVLAPSDSTPPVITPNVSGTLGNNGWYTSDVTVSWSVTDAESAISSSSGCGTTTINTDTSGQTLTCSATSAGGSNSQSVTIKRDATPPIVSLVGGPADGGTYYFGSVPAEPGCSASDATSGLDGGGCSVSDYPNSVGTHTVIASAVDKAGNSASSSATYEVLAWTLSGFYSPVEMGGSTVLNTVKGGSTVPLKFEIFAGPTELTDAAIVSMSLRPMSCTNGAEDPIDVVTSGNTSLRYDTDSGQFIQNWKTPKLPGKCYEVKMTAQDGSSIVAYFKLK